MRLRFTCSAVNRRPFSSTDSPCEGTPQDTHHQAADRIPVLVGKIHVRSSFSSSTGSPPVHPVSPVPGGLDVGVLAVVLVNDLADNLLEEVLQGHQPHQRPVLVDHQGHAIFLLHVLQEVGDPLRFGDEHRLAGQLFQAAALVGVPRSRSTSLAYTIPTMSSSRSR